VLTAIYRSVGELVGEGADKITFPVIAERAGVNPTTLYRRWEDVNALLCDLSNYMAHFVRIIWPSQAPTTRTSRAASMASGVMVSRLLMVMMRATWLMSRSTSRKLPPVMRTMLTTDSASAWRCGS